MSSDADSALDNLSKFVLAIAEDAKMREQFWAIAKLSPTQRFAQIHAMAERMAAAREDAEFVSSFRLLADARVFDAAMAALHELGHNPERG